MISFHISRVSAGVLGLGGLALLFAPDAVLPTLVPAFPPAAAWLGQLVAAAWLGVAALNCLTRSSMLGGIYGRPTVAANAMLYFVSATSLLRVLAKPSSPTTLWLLFVPAALFAILYTWLLFRGPFKRDFERRAGV